MLTAGKNICKIVPETSENLNENNRQTVSPGAFIGLHDTGKMGFINFSVSGSTYLHDLSKNSVDAYGYLRLRLLKGLSLSISASAAYINDRLNQRKGALTEAERLLRLKQQATSFEIGASVKLITPSDQSTIMK